VSRSIGSPLGSTNSTLCSSQSNAFDLRICACEFGHGVVLLVRLADVLGLLAVLHRHPGVLGVEVVGLDLDRLGVGDGAQREIDLDGLDRGAAHRLDELLRLLAGGCEPLPEIDALGLELLHGALDPLVEVGIDHRLGHLDLDEFGERRSARRRGPDGPG
jgi:hypothetical protein